MKRLSSRSCALEACMKILRQCANDLVSVDAFDRWGPKHDPVQVAEIEALARSAEARRRDARQRLEQLLAEARAEEPEAIRAWAAARVALHQRYIEAHPDDAHSTHRFVAAEEMAQWQEVRDGTRAYVEENPCWGQPDPEAYRGGFGFDPA